MVHLLEVLKVLAFGGSVCAFLLVAKWIGDAIESRKTACAGRLADRGIRDGNLALGLRRSGFYLGLAVALLGPLGGESSGSFAYDMLYLALDGALVTVLLIVSSLINEVAILPGADNDQAVAQGNTAVGAVECCGYLATALVLNGSFSGTGGGLLSAVVFFALGQLALVVGVRAYAFSSRYARTEVVEGGNTAAGITMGGMLLCLGWVMRTSLLGEFTGWQHDVLAFGATALSAAVLLVALNWLIDLLFLPGATFREEILEKKNAAAMLVVASVRLAVSLAVCWVIA